MPKVMRSAELLQMYTELLFSYAKQFKEGRIGLLEYEALTYNAIEDCLAKYEGEEDIDSLRDVLFRNWALMDPVPSWLAGIIEDTTGSPVGISSGWYDKLKYIGEHLMREYLEKKANRSKVSTTEEKS